MTDFKIELQGTPDEVQEMLNKASRIEGATAYKKKKIGPDHYQVWYRGKGAPNDLIAAIKKAAGLTKSKRSSRGRKRAAKADETPAERTIAEVIEDAQPEDGDNGGASPGSPETTA